MVAFKVPWQTKTLATKPDDLSYMPRTYLHVEKKELTPAICPLTYTHTQ